MPIKKSAMQKNPRIYPGAGKHETPTADIPLATDANTAPEGGCVAPADAEAARPDRGAPCDDGRAGVQE